VGNRKRHRRLTTTLIGGSDRRCRRPIAFAGRVVGKVRLLLKCQADQWLRADDARNPNYKGPGLLLEFTVEDPGRFTTPWSARITYRRPLGRWPEFVCADSTVDYVGRTINLPRADKPDF
jgi:hypothetical protein